MNRLAPLVLPDLSRRVALVTGATSGIGLEVARALMAAGAQVILAVRNQAKGVSVAEQLSASTRGSCTVEVLDTSLLSSVDDFAVRFGDRQLDLLVANAGSAAPRRRAITREGHELTLATNYLGHARLVCRLLPALSAAGGRVVTVGSFLAQRATLDPGDLELDAGYSASRAYANSKLAAILFAAGLDRRSRLHGWGIRATSAHPGWSRTGFMGQGGWPAMTMAAGEALRVLQSAADGAQPVLLAATGDLGEESTYFGPTQRWGLVGPPGRVPLPRTAQVSGLGDRLWDATTRLAGLSWPENAAA